MMEFLQKIRLVPIVLVAATGLFVLKLIGIAVDGGYTLGAGHQAKSDRSAREFATTVITRPAQSAQQEAPARPKSWAQEMFGYPDVTGSVGATPKEEKPAEANPADARVADAKSADAKPAEPKPVEAKPADAPKTIQKPMPKPVQSGTPVRLDATPVSPAERALLERLSERRQELEKRQSELEMRDTLLKAAEKRLEERINELKEAEARIVAATQKKEEAEVQRLKNLVTMYENMKAKDAAKIFDRLDIKLATEVAKLIQPRRMSDILAQMTPESAQRLTVELANTSRGETTQQARPAELPKIQGRPNGT